MFYFYFYCFVNIDKKWMFRERIFRFTWHSRQINSRCHTHVCALLSGGGDLWTANPLGRAASMEANVELFLLVPLLESSLVAAAAASITDCCCFDYGDDTKVTKKNPS